VLILGFRSKKAIAKGEIVTISYGSSHTVESLLGSYGFATKEVTTVAGPHLAMHLATLLSRNGKAAQPLRAIFQWMGCKEHVKQTGEALKSGLSVMQAYLLPCARALSLPIGEGLRTIAEAFQEIPEAARVAAVQRAMATPLVTKAELAALKLLAGHYRRQLGLDRRWKARNAALVAAGKANAAPLRALLGARESEREAHERVLREVELLMAKQGWDGSWDGEHAEPAGGSQEAKDEEGLDLDEDEEEEVEAEEEEEDL